MFGVRCVCVVLFEDFNFFIERNRMAEIYRSIITYIKLVRSFWDVVKFIGCVKCKCGISKWFVERGRSYK